MSYTRAAQLQMTVTGHKGMEQSWTGKAQVGHEENVLHQRVVGHWNRPPREGVTEAKSLNVKEHLDSQLSFKYYCEEQDMGCGEL